jgi:hypothetical protein
MAAQVYSQIEGMSQVVNTAWAMLSLLDADYHKHNAQPLHEAARFLLKVLGAEGLHQAA